MGLLGSGYAIPVEFRNNTYESVMARFGDIARSTGFPWVAGMTWRATPRTRSARCWNRGGERGGGN